jgi:hypothetical protein
MVSITPFYFMTIPYFKLLIRFFMITFVPDFFTIICFSTITSLIFAILFTIYFTTSFAGPIFFQLLSFAKISSPVNLALITASTQFAFSSYFNSLL